MAAPVRTGPPPPPPPPDVIAPPAPPRPTSRLELIPRELRERIYDFLFPAADLRLTNTCPPTDPALACVSRQLRAEVLPRAYDAVSIHLAWSPSSLPPQPPPQPPISSSSPSLQRAPAPLWTVARWLDPDRGGAARLALTRRLTLVIDEESGYSGSVQPERTYASSPWAAALPALSRALLCRVRRLGRLTVHVKGKKKCHAQFVECDLKAGGEGYGERYDRPRGAVFSIGPRMDDCRCSPEEGQGRRALQKANQISFQSRVRLRRDAQLLLLVHEGPGAGPIRRVRRVAGHLPTLLGAESCLQRLAREGQPRLLHGRVPTAQVLG